MNENIEKATKPTTILPAFCLSVLINAILFFV
jgi:hypothetical protein